MRINTNVSSLTAIEANTQTNKILGGSLEKLSTGLRINKASDDASGLAIADKLRTQASTLNQAVANGNSAVSMLQIADKAMAEQSNILDIVKQKLVQAGTATTSAEGRFAVSKDIDKLLDQLDNIAKMTNYNGVYLLQASGSDTDSAASQVFQMGSNSNDTITLGGGVQSNSSGITEVENILSLTSGVTSAGSAMTAASARNALADIDSALNQLNSWRSDIGSTQNQLESAVRNLMTQVTNIKAAESVIRDVDYAAESANFNKQNIVAQASTFAISQATASSQNVLRLLQ